MEALLTPGVTFPGGTAVPCPRRWTQTHFRPLLFRPAVEQQLRSPNDSSDCRQRHLPERSHNWEIAVKANIVQSRCAAMKQNKCVVGHEYLAATDVMFAVQRYYSPFSSTLKFLRVECEVISGVFSYVMMSSGHEIPDEISLSLSPRVSREWL